MSDLIRAAVLSHYQDYARSLGLDAAAQVHAVGLPVGCVDQPDMFISYGRFIALLENSALASAHPFFGLRLGALQGIDQFGALGYLLSSSNTVAEALASFQRYFHTFSAGSSVDVKVEGGVVRLVYQLAVQSTPSLRQGIELALAVGVGLMRTLCGPQWRAQSISIQTALTKPANSYKQVLGLVPHGDADENSITFAQAWLEQPLSQADPLLRRLMQAQVQMQDRLYSDETPRRVAQIIRSLLAQGDATVEIVAGHLALSPRSLQRVLKEQGSSFQALLDDCRRNLAEQYLRESDLQLTQIAGILGYVEQSSFTRAFIRWFGCSPRQWLRTQNFCREP